MSNCGGKRGKNKKRGKNSLKDWRSFDTGSYSPSDHEGDDPNWRSETAVQFEVFHLLQKDKWSPSYRRNRSEIGKTPETETKDDYENPETVNDCNVCKEFDLVYDATNNLSKDFISALRRNSFTDVSIKCGEYVQQAHRFVLAARSPIFEAMFSTPTVESEIGEVIIYDTDSDILKDMIDFIYGAQVKNLTLSKACRLLYAAEKYQINGLKDVCLNHLRSCLSVQTALTILQCADSYDKNLKDDTLSYVCQNFFSLKTTEEWKALQIQKPNLCFEVYSMVVENYEKILDNTGSWRDRYIRTRYNLEN